MTHQRALQLRGPEDLETKRSISRFATSMVVFRTTSIDGMTGTTARPPTDLLALHASLKREAAKQTLHNRMTWIAFSPGTKVREDSGHRIRRSRV